MDGFGEGSAELVDGFEGVVEGDDRAITRVPLYIINDIFGCHPFGVVSGNEIPHHNFIFSAEPGILGHSHPSMGRTYVVALDVGIGFLHIIAVLLDGVS